ncbi:hypothetical protein Pst134EA_031325 [Puccinia striiformis f. sp. tritici]|uniref:uncharacterized protein n=1 Tax=Puccinia striiformis f. sp. tritici TaxID=168172 RepID=UPI002008B88B|nr:uncharacterized protein Pst134EA_031325 [Puccinia striiformis f. sp. tritici]KAH9443375.1 hypothetical protein Pst134EA_031325 [Puccinia striiformis f. sp. tritici]
MPNFVLPVLQSVEVFLAELESHFSVTVEIEEARKVLRSLRQGNSSIQEFNNTFNSHLWSVVGLDDMSKSEIYIKAIAPSIGVGCFTGSWKDLGTLALKQEMAVSLSSDSALPIVDRIMAGKQSQHQHSQIPRTVTQTRVDQRVIQPPPKLDNAPKLGTHFINSDHAPMDIDALEAEAGFDIDVWKSQCRRMNMCWRCGGDFDDAHSVNKGCCIPRIYQLSPEQRVNIWKDWGGHLSNSPPPTRQPRSSGSAPLPWPRGKSFICWNGEFKPRTAFQQPCSGTSRPENEGRFDKGKKRESSFRRLMRIRLTRSGSMNPKPPGSGVVIKS